MPPSILCFLCLCLISCSENPVETGSEGTSRPLYFDAGETAKNLVGYEAYHVDVAAYDFYNKRLWLDAKFLELNQRLLRAADQQKEITKQDSAKLVAAFTAVNGLFSVVMSEAEKRSIEKLINMITQGNESARQAALRSFSELEVRRIGDFKKLAGNQLFKSFKSKLEKQKVSFRRTKKILKISKLSGVLGVLGTATLTTFEALSINTNSRGPFIPKDEFEYWLNQTESFNATLDHQYEILELKQRVIKREQLIKNSDK